MVSVPSAGSLQLGIKTRLQDFGLMYHRHNSEWLCLGCAGAGDEVVPHCCRLYQVCQTIPNTVGHVLQWKDLALLVAICYSHYVHAIVQNSESPHPTPHVWSPHHPPCVESPHPLPLQLLYTAVAEIIGSYWLALIFQVSHVISEVDWPSPDANNFVNRDW